ncbi:hypothetical protein PINS_up012967 [Pythium insidiosum]|nr:hypothetical protein PINS_up012967 [Pythium insidiosum]
MSKRRSENGQMRREEWEHEQENGDSGSDAPAGGFARASEATIRQRRIVTARPRKAPGATPATAAATTNPFQGFQGLSASKPPAEKSNPFAGFSGLTGGAATSTSTPAPAPKPLVSATATSAKKAPSTYQEAMEKLNSEFLAFAQTHLKQNPASDWTAGVQDYLKYAEEIATKFASSKPVPAKPLLATAAAPSTTVPSFLSATAKKPETNAATPAPAPSAGFSFGKKPETESNADTTKAPAKTATSSLFGGAKSSDATTTEKTIPAFSFGAAPKAPESSSTSTEKPSSGFSFGAKPSSGFSFGAKPATTASPEKKTTTPAFSFGAAAKGSESSSSEEKPSTSSGFSFGAKTTASASTEKTTPAFSFGAAPSSSSKTDGASDSTAPAKPAFSFGASAPSTTASSGFSFNLPASKAVNVDAAAVLVWSRSWSCACDVHRHDACSGRRCCRCCGRR